MWWIFLYLCCFPPFPFFLINTHCAVSSLPLCMHHLWLFEEHLLSLIIQLLLNLPHYCRLYINSLSKKYIVANMSIWDNELYFKKLFTRRCWYLFSLKISAHLNRCQYQLLSDEAKAWRINKAGINLSSTIFSKEASLVILTSLNRNSIFFANVQKTH